MGLDKNDVLLIIGHGDIEGVFVVDAEDVERYRELLSSVVTDGLKITAHDVPSTTRLFDVGDDD